MAIDLPPTLPPQLVDVAGIEAAARAGASTVYKRFTVFLDDSAACLQADMLTEAADNADTLSDVVRALARSCYAAGYPSSQILYARDGDTIFVTAAERIVGRMSLPPEYHSYFEGLVGEALTDNALEPKRALAGAKADRHGEDLQLGMALEPDETVVFGAQASTGKPSGKLTPQFGNLGNRFVGRYLAALDIEQSFRGGWTTMAAARTALRGLNDDNGLRADRYNEQQLGVSKVTPWGIFGITGRAVQFDDIEDAALPFAANIEQGSLNWASILSASFQHRLTATAEVERINRETELRPGDLLAFRELYTAVGLGVGYERKLGLGGSDLTLSGSVGVSQGLGDDDNALTLADLGYTLFRPELGANYALPAGWSVGLQARAQISSDVVPEQKQWVIGGTDSVHAFLPGVASGDEGHAAKLQVRAPKVELGPIEVTGRVFVETAEAESNQPGSSSISLADAGIGLDWNWGKYARGLVAYADPIDDDDLTEAARRASDANVLFAIAIDFGAL